MELEGWMVVLATLLSPLIALQVSVRLARRREKEDRRFRVFQALMTNRAASLSPHFVEALNMVDVAFYGADKKSRDVVEACKLLIEHHNRSPMSETWGTRREDLLVDMLQKMATALEFDFDKVTIKNTSYFPRGFGEMELEGMEIRKLTLALLRGERSLPIAVPNEPAASTDAPQAIQSGE